jgi:hypothetical protein
MSKKIKKNTESLSGYIIWKGGKNFQFQSLDGQTLAILPESVSVSGLLRKHVFVRGFLKKDGLNCTIEGAIVITQISTDMFFNQN